MSAQVAREVNGDWTSRKLKQHWQSVQELTQAKGFLKKPSVKKRWGIVQSEQKPAKNKSRKLEQHWQSVQGLRQAKGFLKKNPL